MTLLWFFFFKVESRHFFNTINQIHPVLIFTSELKHNNSFPFFDILIECTNFGLQMSIYRKPMFTGLYTRWGSFCPQRHKINLIKTLVHQGLNDLLQTKTYWWTEFIKKTLLKNGYLDDVSTNTIEYKMPAILHQTKIWAREVPSISKITVDWQYLHAANRTN